eukprot:762582-Hanusia_phi.AAC.2
MRSSLPPALEFTSTLSPPVALEPAYHLPAAQRRPAGEAARRIRCTAWPGRGNCFSGLAPTE